MHYLENMYFTTDMFWLKCQLFWIIKPLYILDKVDKIQLTNEQRVLHFYV